MIGLLNKRRRRTVQAAAQVLHREGDVTACRGRRVHQAADPLLKRLDELGICVRCCGQGVRNVLIVFRKS